MYGFCCWLDPPVLVMTDVCTDAGIIGVRKSPTADVEENIPLRNCEFTLKVEAVAKFPATTFEPENRATLFAGMTATLDERFV
jgi:hypothetical protein